VEDADVHAAEALPEPFRADTLPGASATPYCASMRTPCPSTRPQGLAAGRTRHPVAATARILHRAAKPPAPPQARLSSGLLARNRLAARPRGGQINASAQWMPRRNRIPVAPTRRPWSSQPQPRSATAGGDPLSSALPTRDNGIGPPHVELLLLERERPCRVVSPPLPLQGRAAAALAADSCRPRPSDPAAPTPASGAAAPALADLGRPVRLGQPRR
jgi:hypothetical protein